MENTLDAFLVALLDVLVETNAFGVSIALFVLGILIGIGLGVALAITIIRAAK